MVFILHTICKCSLCLPGLLGTRQWNDHCMAIMLALLQIAKPISNTQQLLYKDTISISTRILVMTNYYNKQMCRYFYLNKIAMFNALQKKICCRTGRWTYFPYYRPYKHILNNIFLIPIYMLTFVLATYCIYLCNKKYDRCHFCCCSTPQWM